MTYELRVENANTPLLQAEIVVDTILVVYAHAASQLQDVGRQS